MKKQKVAWQIAIIHYITAGLLFPFSIVLVSSFILVMFIEYSLFFYYIIVALWLIGIWLGVKSSAKFLNKNHIINEKHAIIKLSTIYYFIIGLSVLFFLVSGSENLISELLVGFFILIIYLVAFNFSSKKYIKTDNEYVKT